LEVPYPLTETDLPSAKGAAFNSYVDRHDAICHPGTREDLLRQIEEWADDPQGKCIFWLNGMDGTGKSTISRTVAQSFDKYGKLGASFFFKRGESERDKASRFFTTITRHLWSRVPALRPHIRNAIDKESEISEKSLKDQFEKLIFEPLSQASIQIPTLVIVVDALDECEPEADVRTILHLLSQTRHLQSVRMRIFLTSRPELLIRLGFKKISADAHQDMILEDIAQDTIKNDISVYLKIELAKTKEEYNIRFPDSQLPPDWPGDEKIQSLAVMAVPLFIFAATVCRFVGDHRRNPKKRLAIVLEYQTASEASNLDLTYLPVLDQLMNRCPDSEKEILIREFREIVGSIIILAEPLSKSSLANLLDISKEDIDITLDDLHSVLSIPSNLNSPVRLLHLSFRDFLLDRRKNEFWFWIDGTKTHEMIAIRCLELMSRQNCLRENMCGLEFPGMLRNEIDEKTLYDCLPSDVQYACQYWVHHLEQSGRRIRDQGAIHFFLQQHFLHWLEALSIMGKISKSISLIGTLQSLVAVSSSNYNTLY
jgi:NACHT domain